MGSVQETCRLAAASQRPVWFEPVSAPKASRASGCLHLLTYASPNIEELVAMATAIAASRCQHPSQSMPSLSIVQEEVSLVRVFILAMLAQVRQIMHLQSTDL